MATLVTCRSGPLITPIVGSICELCQDEDDELREAAITTIEAILRKSPSSIHNIEKFIEILNESIQYDPNYCADFDESDDDNEYSDEEDDEDYSDDEDVSWKVRRSCAKCYDAIVTSPYASNDTHMKDLANTLLSRFRGNILYDQIAIC